MTKRIRIGISTCPNDTFSFAPLIGGKIDTGDLDFEFELMDIDQLNRKLAASELDVGKCSFHAALHFHRDYLILRSGSALGFGVGPLLLASRDGMSMDRLNAPGQAADKPLRMLCPGELTTATLLARTFCHRPVSEGSIRIEQVVFSDIMPALKSGSADLGVCIHEGRFTWQQQGLHFVDDLGARWENETKSPIALGGIVAAHRLGPERLKQIQKAVKESVRLALQTPTDSLPIMQQHAQELSDAVIWEHVKLYVNDWTVDIGDEGELAIGTMFRKAIESKIIPASTPKPMIMARH